LPIPTLKCLKLEEMGMLKSIWEKPLGQLKGQIENNNKGPG